MHRRRIESALLAGLAVVVVGLAAATLGDTTNRQPASGSGGSVVGGGGGGGSAATDVAVATEPIPVFAILGVLAAVALLFGAIRYPLGTLWEVVRMLAMAALVVALLWAFLLVVGVGGLPEPAASDVPLRGAGDGAGLPGPGGSDGGPPVATPTTVGLLAAVLVGVGLLAVALRGVDGGRGDDEGGDGEETLAAVGRSAGRAADRIEDLGAPVDNEVYAAWKEMTGHLDVDSPGARTPGEFREAARDAGMDAADVDDLTDLFESVRYGGATPTGDREARATAALRRIEERYAGEDER